MYQRVSERSGLRLSGDFLTDQDDRLDVGEIRDVGLGARTVGGERGVRRLQIRETQFGDKLKAAPGSVTIGR